jgi:hypothetical protein
MAAKSRSTKTPPEGTPEGSESDPLAHDGQPSEDELARRRREREPSGTSLAERAADGEPAGEDDDEQELFKLGSLEGDPKVTLKNLLRPGVAVEPSASMGTAAVPIKGSGFFDPEQEITLLVRVLPGGPVPVATRKKGDEKHKIEKWRVTQPLTPIFVQEASGMFTREQVLEMFHAAGVPSSTITRVLGDEPSTAQAG